MARAGTGTKLKLQPADPFDLIRWLARTQSDPRKAVAELVQNSIDANARSIQIERRRLRGAPALIIRDDGEGVLPAKEREEALRYIATHVGHSHKLGLSATERHARVIAGQYGVGLLGFWAIGRRMELRSRVAGSDVHVLTLEEDRPTARLAKMPRALDAAATFTELVILELHEAAQRALAGRRLTDYLAAELRGPILQTGVVIEVRDHMARGMAQKQFIVTPRRFDGVRLDVPSEVSVDGYAPIRVELYLSRGAERPSIQLACAGTLVAEDLADVDVLGFAGAPWVGRELTGIVDFPGFQVPPGTRRGVVPNAAAIAFAQALARIEPAISRELDRFDRQRRAEADRQVVDELRKAMRGLRQRMPHYDLPAVANGEAGNEPAGAGRPISPPATDDSDEPELEVPPDAQPELFPLGALARITIAPDPVRIEPGHERRVRVRAFDARDRLITDGLVITWQLDAAGFALAGAQGPRPAVSVDGDVLPGAQALLGVEVVRDGVHIEATARVLAIEPRTRDATSAGIPKPELVDAAGASWRSRMNGPAWEVNSGHEDYVALRSGRARLRYLVALLGKEIVQRTYSQPGAGELLEHLVAVIAHAERNLTTARDDSA